ncbi:hypothetical protein [Zymobacter sp. IVIA_12111.31 C1]|uniref:hypothetical protein n=1 Tax=Zymobacter sp. IVIA_12111.31 C1 TaxID=3394854 RepID=UPI0039C4E4E2
MNYKDYTELLNEKLTSEIKKINLLYTNDSTKEFKIKELKREYDYLKLIQIDDLNLSQSNYLFEKYNEIKESTTFSSIFHEDDFYANAENFVIGTINLLPFFVYKYIQISSNDGTLLIERKRLDKLLESIKDNIKVKNNEENDIITYSDYINLLNNKMNAEMKLVEYNFRFGFQKEEFEKEYSKLKCKTIKELSSKEKLNYINNLKSDIDRSESSYISCLINSAFHMIPYFMLKYCKKDEEHNFFKINKESYLKLISDLKKGLEENNDGGMSLKPKKTKSLEI